LCFQRSFFLPARFWRIEPFPTAICGFRWKEHSSVPSFFSCCQNMDVQIHFVQGFGYSPDGVMAAFGGRSGGDCSGLRASVFQNNPVHYFSRPVHGAKCFDFFNSHKFRKVFFI